MTAPIATGWSDPVAGRESHPLTISALSRRTEKSEEMRNEYSEMEAKSITHTETAASGSISTGIILNNTGPVSFHLTDLGMTVRLFERAIDPDDPLFAGSFKTVATLVPVLGDGYTLAPGQSTPVLQVQAEDVNTDRIKDLLRDPHALHLEQAYYELETEDGLNYGFLEEVTRASTATIMVDFGDREWHKYRFASTVNRNPDGSPTGVRLADALNLLGVEFQTVMQYDNEEPPNEIRRVLARVQKEDGVWVPSSDPDQFAQWAVFGSNDDFADVNLDFEDVVLHAGDMATLVFARDVDGDGLYAWDEQHYGTSDDSGNADYDSDGLTDYVEVSPRQVDNGACPEPPCFEPAGWDVEVQGQAPYHVFSDPRAADGDEDGLDDQEERGGCEVAGEYDPTFADETACTAGGGVWLGTPTDPNNKDTDGDGISDFDDAAPTVPARTLRVKQDSLCDPDVDECGASWTEAFPYLQDAILEAKTSNLDDSDPDNDVSEIWVASGAYTFDTMQPLLPHVGIYGGFFGVETKRSQRAGLPTTVDGSGAAPGQVAFCNAPLSSLGAHGAVLDGLTMTYWSYGALDMAGNSEDVMLRNMQFIGNGNEDGGVWGGAMKIQGGGSWTLENCVLANNRTSPAGGAMFAAATDGYALELVIRDCQFLDNWALAPQYVTPLEDNWGGGAIYAGKGPSSQVDKLHLTDCLFLNNSLEAPAYYTARGGAVYAWKPHDLAVTNCVFHHNYVTSPTGYAWAETDNGMWAYVDTDDSCAVTNLHIRRKRPISKLQRGIVHRRCRSEASPKPGFRL